MVVSLFCGAFLMIINWMLNRDCDDDLLHWWSNLPAVDHFSIRPSNFCISNCTSGHLHCKSALKYTSTNWLNCKRTTALHKYTAMHCKSTLHNSRPVNYTKLHQSGSEDSYCIALVVLLYILAQGLIKSADHCIEQICCGRQS